MTPFSLSEYNPDFAELHLLHVLIKLHPDQYSRFIKSLNRCFGDLYTEYDREHQVFLLRTEAETEPGKFLMELSDLLNNYCRETGIEPEPEILETRMVDPEAVQRKSSDFSRHISLFNEGAELVAGRLPLILESGTTFGSGTHPSTRLAVQALETIYENQKVFPGRVLDVGCGSGVLALCCGLLGAEDVQGVDISDESIAAARNNARRNRLSARVAFSGRQLSELSGPYDLVTANLTAAVMNGMLDEFVSLLGSGSKLVLSGLLGRQQQEMAARLESRGLLVTGCYQEGQWRALLLAAGDGRP